MVQLVAKAEVQRQPRTHLPIVLEEKVLVPQILDAEQIPRKCAGSLERQTEQKVSPGVTRIRAGECKVATASGSVCSGCVVAAEVGAEFHTMRSADPGDTVENFVLVVAEFN